MPKKERNIAREESLKNIEDIKKKFEPIVGEAQGQLPGAKEQAAGAYGEASGVARNLAGGNANEYVKNLAITGGLSEDEAQAMETAATRNVRSVYDVLGAEAQRKQAITGGYGGAGALSQMARQGGQTAAEAGTNARAEIARLRQGGRISGAGMSQQQQIEGARLLTQQYGISQDQANYVMDYILKAQATGIQLTQVDIANIVELSKQKGTFGAIAEGIGQIGGATAGVMGGIAGLK